jgi:hypothetical protein
VVLVVLYYEGRISSKKGRKKILGGVGREVRGGEIGWRGEKR